MTGKAQDAGAGFKLAPLFCDHAVLQQGQSVPVAVRYAWGNAPEVALFNAEGLPASPFRCALPDSQAWTTGLQP